MTTWYEHVLYAFYPTGILKWNYTAGDQFTSSPVIGADKTLYVGCSDGNLYTFGPSD